MKRVLGGVLVVLLVFLGFLLVGIDRNVASGEYTVKSGQTLHGGLMISSPGVVTIEQGARVDGAIFMGSGVLNLNGEVGGGILSLSGEVHMGPQALVRGHLNVTSVPFTETPGARIERNLAADVAGWLGGPIGAALVMLALTAYIFSGRALGELISRRERAGETAESRAAARRNTVLAGGLVLVAAGGLLLAGVIGAEISPWAWALAILLPGLALFALLVAQGRPGSPLAVPASVLTMTGLILAYQAATGHWESWAYAWALVLPASVGIGRMVEGWWGRDSGLVRDGVGVAGLGLGLFAAGVIFFEVIAGVVEASAALLLALALIAAGIYVLLSRTIRPARPAAKA